MEVRAVAKSVRVSPRKTRLIADAIRDLPIEEAYKLLAVTQKRAVTGLVKALTSAVANAVNNAKLDKETLVIRSIMVNEAPALKRFRPSTRGRIHPYKKRGSHITIVLSATKTVSPVTPVTSPEKIVEKKAVAAKVDTKVTAEKKETKEEKSFLGLPKKKEVKK